MRVFSVSSGLVALAAVVACGLGDSAVPTDQNGLAVANAPGSAVASSNAPETKNFVAHLSGDNEVPARPTLGQGELKMQLSADGKSLDYRIISSNISNVVQSHIHIAPAGVNGSIVVFLYGLVPSGGGRTDGVLAKGTITAANTRSAKAATRIAISVRRDAAIRSIQLELKVGCFPLIAPRDQI